MKNYKIIITRMFGISLAILLYIFNLKLDAFLTVDYDCKLLIKFVSYVVWISIPLIDIYINAGEKIIKE